jgi:hypothetical protein
VDLSAERNVLNVMEQHGHGLIAFNATGENIWVPQEGDMVDQVRIDPNFYVAFRSQFELENGFARRLGKDFYLVAIPKGSSSKSLEDNVMALTRAIKAQDKHLNKPSKSKPN